LVFVNNIEFGVPTALSAVTVFAIMNRKGKSRTKLFSLLLMGLLTSFVSFVVFLMTIDDGFNLDYFLLFIKTFGGGVFSVPMPVFGAHLIVLAFLFTGAVLGFRKLIQGNWNDSSLQLVRIQQDAILVASFLGLVGLMTFPYFVNRSVISSQLQIYLLLVALIIIASFSIIGIDFIESDRRKKICKIMLILLPQSILISSLMQAPDGRNEWARLSDFNSTTFSDQTNLVKQILGDAKALVGEDIQYAVINQGNLYLAGTQVMNVSLVDDPEDVVKLTTDTNGLKGLFCDQILHSLENQRSPILVENFFADIGNRPICSDFIELHKLSGSFSIAVWSP